MPGGEPSSQSRWATLWVPVLSAAAATVGLYGFLKVLTVTQLANSGLRTPLVLLLAVALFLVLGYRIGIGTAAGQTGRWSAVLARVAATYGGIAVGVIIWVFVEELILRHFAVYPIYEEHNLFPIEIVMLWVLAALPLLVGTGLGLILFRRLVRMTGDTMKD
jgi:hypothetical protein